jgi:DNA-binding NtrC family response regulator
MTKVLLVDDEQDSLEVLAWWFEMRGYEVLVSSSAEQALEMGTRCHPDLVVTDYYLGDEVNGVDVVARLRESMPGLAAVLVTGMLDVYSTPKLRKGQRMTVLTKPFDFARLNAAVTAELALRPN